MSGEKRTSEFGKKIADSITIFSIFAIINYIILIIIYFITPVYRIIDDTTGKISYYYWNSYFESFNNNSELLGQGYEASFPRAISYVVIIALSFLLAINLTLIVLSLWAKNLTRIQAISIFIWPTFIFNSIIFGGLIAYNYVIATLAETTTIKVHILSSLKYGFVLSILVLLFVLVLAMYLSHVYLPQKEIMKSKRN